MKKWRHVPIHSFGLPGVGTFLHGKQKQDFFGFSAAIFPIKLKNDHVCFLCHGLFQQNFVKVGLYSWSRRLENRKFG